MSPTPLDLYQAHVDQLATRDVEAAMAGYAPDAVMILDGEASRGPEEIRAALDRARGDGVFADDLDREITYAGDVVFVRWRLNRSHQHDLIGSETVVFADGLISAHTAFSTPRG